MLVYDGKNYYEAEFHPRKLVSRSGRGDTVISSYMARRIPHSPEEEVIRAAAASIKMEAEGLLNTVLRTLKSLFSKSIDKLIYNDRIALLKDVNSRCFCKSYKFIRRCSVNDNK